MHQWCVVAVGWLIDFGWVLLFFFVGCTCTTTTFLLRINIQTCTKTHKIYAYLDPRVQNGGNAKYAQRCEGGLGGARPQQREERGDEEELRWVVCLFCVCQRGDGGMGAEGAMNARVCACLCVYINHIPIIIYNHHTRRLSVCTHAHTPLHTLCMVLPGSPPPGTS